MKQAYNIFYIKTYVIYEGSVIRAQFYEQRSHNSMIITSTRPDRMTKHLCLLLQIQTSTGVMLSHYN